jgi:UDP-2-acetamido-3-amino-2,3-dideoxy-glucuronate N-acetyltransferase
MSERAYFAHPTSCVDEPCTIGDGTKIWHFSHVMADSVIGRQCTIGQNVFVASGVRIGDHCKIQNNVSVYTGVVLEDHVFCGPSMVFTNVVNPRSEVVRKDEYKPTRVKQGASIGANATILCGVTLGAYAFVGAGAVVTHDVPDFALVTGNPARRTGWMCRCGMKLEPASEKPRCAACGSAYSYHVDTLRLA